MKTKITSIIIYFICLANIAMTKESGNNVYIPMYESSKSFTSLFSTIFNNFDKYKKNDFWIAEIYEYENKESNDGVLDVYELIRYRILSEHGLSTKLRINRELTLINRYDYSDYRDGDVIFGLHIMFGKTRTDLDKQFGEHRHSYRKFGEYRTGDEYWIVEERNFIYLITLGLKQSSAFITIPERQHGVHVELKVYQLYYPN